MEKYGRICEVGPCPVCHPTEESISVAALTGEVHKENCPVRFKAAYDAGVARAIEREAIFWDLFEH